jgi:antitoxin (DNA-binding transcriptional repressor) of toxin-antitoxin stability system
MSKIARTGEVVVITKNGKPIAELRPHRPRTQSATDIWKDQLVVEGDYSRSNADNGGYKPARLEA